MPTTTTKYYRHERWNSYSKIIHKVTNKMTGGCNINGISKAVVI